MNKRNPLTLTPFILLLLAGLPALAQPGAADAPPEVDADAPKVITIDREAGVIDLAAKMVPAEPQWLELIATTPGPKGREHEAIVTIDAKPSHIHLALVTLGLEPGHPLMNRREGEDLITEPPTGPAVELFFVYEKDGQTLETPAHKWVLDAETGEPLPACNWLFTGSVFKQWQGRAYYMADEAGTIASLVNFGDDLIVRQTDTSQDTDFQQLQINKEVIAPYGSELVLRIRIPHAPAEDAPRQADQTPTQPHDGKASDKPAPVEP